MRYKRNLLKGLGGFFERAVQVCAHVLIHSLRRMVHFTRRILSNYGFLLLVGILLLYTITGRDFINSRVTLATQTVTELTNIGRYRLASAILAILFFLIGFVNQDGRQRRMIVGSAALLALLTVPAIFVLLGQLALSSTELQLIANAFQSAGSLLLVILTLSYVVATRDLHKSNWERIFDRRKEHYRPTAKRIISDFIDPLCRTFAEQKNTLIAAKNGRLRPLPCKANLSEDLIRDIEYISNLNQEHVRKRGRIKSYNLYTISSDAHDYRRLQSQYEDRYNRVFKQVRKKLYRISSTGEGPVNLKEEEKQIVQNRLEDLTKYLLEAYPVWQHEIEHDPELSKIYPKIYEERHFFIENTDPNFENAKDIAEKMLEINEEFITKPNKISDWRSYIMEEYYLTESEV